MARARSRARVGALWAAAAIWAASPAAALPATLAGALQCDPGLPATPCGAQPKLRALL